MTFRYVRSTDGNNSDNGSTWALAKLDLVGASAIDAAGDTIYVSHVHNETTAGTIQPSWNGTSAAPVNVICANDGAQPPTASATTAVVTTTGAGFINLFTGVAYYYGHTFNCGTGSTAANIALGNGSGSTYSKYESCNFKLVNTGTTAIVNMQEGTYCLNCGFRFADAAQKIHSGAGGVPNVIRGGSVLSGGTSPTFVFNVSSGVLDVEGFDLSNCSSTVDVAGANSLNQRVLFRIKNSKLPASWSGNLVNNTANLNTQSVFEMVNCSAGSENYKYWRQTFYGTIRDEATIVRAGGASDGVTPLSWKMVSGSPVFPHSSLDTEDLLAWNDSVGSTVTATVEIITDGVTLKDNECWIEVMYLGSSSQPLSTLVTDRKADVIGTAANQTSSSESWTTTGLASPVTQKLSVTFTPQMKGYVTARVVLCKASTTVYVDPKLTLT